MNKRNTMKTIPGILAGLVIFVNFGSADDQVCCGDKLENVYTTTISITSELDAPKAAIENVLNSIPYVSGAKIGASGTANCKDICCNDQMLSGGEKTISGTASGSVSVKKVLGPIDFRSPKVRVPGTSCTTSVAFVAGPVVGISASVSLSISGTMDECAHTVDISGSANVTGTVTGGVEGEVTVQACNTEISMTAKATGTAGVSGFVGYSSSGGASGNACFLDVTGDLGCSICFPILGECTFEVARGVVLVNGNC